MAIEAKDKEMETMEQNHRVEVRVYIQKVKHLQVRYRELASGIRTERLGDDDDAICCPNGTESRD